MDDHKKEADFKAFRALLDTDVSVPISHATSGPGAQNMYLVVNLEAARDLGYGQRLSTIFNEHAANMLGDSPKLEKYQDYMRSATSRASHFASHEDIPYDATTLTETNTILLDLQNIHEFYSRNSMLPKSLSWQFTPEDEGLLKRNIFIHENAHATLSLQEPGADFVAAVTMLRENPNSRPLLESLADFRALPIQDEGYNSRYGIECHDAIRHALSLPPEQIIKMHDSEMLGMAQYFDDMNTMNQDLGMNSPEQKAGQTLRGEIINVLSEQADPNSASIAMARPVSRSTDIKPEVLQTALSRAKTSFSSGSEEHRIIESIEHSFNDLMQKRITAEDRPPALQGPTLQSLSGPGSS